MRVAEYGLRMLATKMNVQMSYEIEYATWNEVLRKLDEALKLAENKPRGPQRSAQLKFYSEAAECCRYLKETRNEVAHARKSYDATEALLMIRRVHQFMLMLKTAHAAGLLASVL